MTTQLENHLGPTAMRDALETDVRAGLGATPKSLPPKWFYDARGSDLFDQITRLPNYYPTRCEAAILTAHSPEIAELSGAETLVELGSGTSEKTRMLLDALSAAGTLRRFVPFDVDEWVLTMAAKQVSDEYEGVDVHAVVGDFTEHLALLPREGRRMVAFLGGTIGNLEPGPRAAFLTDLSATLVSGDSVLLGTDLVKGEDRLVPAYDDEGGITAAFNLNVLAVLNRELDADFDLDQFQHLALWDPVESRIEMRLVSLRSQTVRIEALDLAVEFAEGEQMRTEVSSKFTPDRVRDELSAAGLEVTRTWTDSGGDFLVTLAHKP